MLGGRDGARGEMTTRNGLASPTVCRAHADERLPPEKSAAGQPTKPSSGRATKR